MKRIKLEQETVILFNEAEKTGTVWTASPRVKRLLQRAFGPPRSIGPESWQWDTIPKRTIRLPRPTRTATPGVRQALQKARQAAKSSVRTGDVGPISGRRLSQVQVPPDLAETSRKREGSP